MPSKIATPESQTAKAQPPLQVVSLDSVSGYAFGGRQERYNPDLLAARKGGLAIYARMAQDEQVKAALKFKRDSIVGRGYEFAYDETKLSEEEQKKRRRVMVQITRRMTGSFTDGVIAVLKGLQFGFSLTEKVQQNIDVDGTTYIGLAALLGRDAQTFKFHTDEYGVLKKFVQIAGSQERELDIGKFVHYVQNPEEDQYYGLSELRAAYRPWFTKDVYLKLEAAFLERFAGGMALISLGTSGIRPGSPDYDALQSILQNMRSAGGLILPEGVTAEIMEVSSTDAYEKAILRCDLAIAKALLIPNLLGLSNAGQTGAYAQSQTQLEAYFMTLAVDTQRLEQCLNQQLFRPLAQLNWDDGEFPRFRFKKASEEHVKWIIQSWKDLTASNAVITTEEDEAHLREILDFPARDEDDVPVAKVKQDLVPIQIDPNKVPPVVPGQQDDGKKFTEIAERVATSQADVSAALERNSTEISEKFEDFKLQQATQLTESIAPLKDEIKEIGGIAKKLAQRFSMDNALMRVDFAVMAQRTMALEEDVADTVATLSAKAARQLLTDEQLSALLDQDTQDIGALQIDSVSVGKIKGAFRSGLDRAWTTGLMQAMTEVSKARKATFDEPTRKAKVSSLRANAADYFESNAFKMAGSLTDGMRALIQQELLNAVKSGKRPEDAAADIYVRMIEKGYTTLKAVSDASPPSEVMKLVEARLADALNVANVPAYLNTLVRTNTFEALNEARYAEFTDPALGDFVVALRYSAILDDRTTQICEHLDGHVHAVGSKVWESYRPPNHFNCRSVMYAITQLDRWDGVESPEPTVEPQKGFG